MSRETEAKQNNEKWFQGTYFGECTSDPEFQEIAKNFICGEVLEQNCLSDKQKSLVMLTALITCQTYSSVSTYTLAALKAGASTEEIKETAYQCAPYIGMEKVRCALGEINYAFAKEGILDRTEKQGTVTEETRFEKGLAVQQEIFGADNINAMRDAAP